MILHRLDGCAPAPLAHYLKALGLLRLVSEQLDPEARGWWEGERFLLASHADESELLDFLLHRYAPTPLLNPWGARSGFYPGASEKTSREVLMNLEESQDPRFDAFRASISETRRVIAEITSGTKPDDSEDGGKLDLVLGLKRHLRGAAMDWMECVIAIVDGSDREIQQPAIFGTGGSEGSGSYTAAFMKAIRDCLIDKRRSHTLSHALFGRGPCVNSNWSESFGQFLPDGFGSPWDLLLAFEGACAIRSSVIKRSEAGGDRWMSSPFFVPSAGVASPSSARLDEVALNKGKELPGRGEQWFPLWGSPMMLRELQSLFREGRAMVGRKRAVSPFLMSQAVARLGVARGVYEFVRYGYLQRNNLATHFAVPLGRFVVPRVTSAELSCLDDLESWLPHLRRAARDKHAPARLVQAERRLVDALFALTQHPEEAPRWQAVLLRLAEIEALQVHGAGSKAGPIPRLRSDWLEACDDGSAELRLAAAFALQCADPRQRGLRRDGVRRHWLSLKNGRLQPSASDRVMQARNGIDDAIALVARRMIEAGQRGERRLPLEPGCGVAASRHDLARWLAGGLDVDRCLSLARALMALDAGQVRQARSRLRPAPASDWPDDAWLAIRLALLPWPLPDGRKPGSDPAILRRLQAGDLASALELSLRRLRPAGIRCSVRAASASAETARRYAAALAFPIDPSTAAHFAQRLDPTATTEYAP